MGVDQALVVCDLLRERLVGQPGLHLAVVEGVGHTQHFGTAVLGVVVNARDF